MSVEEKIQEIVDKVGQPKDSLDRLEFVMALEDEFKVKLNPKDLVVDMPIQDIAGLIKLCMPSEKPL